MCRVVHMARCNHCGDAIEHPFTCNHCERSHCSDHRLPEQHDCLLHNPETDKRFESAAPNTRERGTGRSRKTGRQPESKEDTGQSKNHCEECNRVIPPTEKKCAQCRASTPTPSSPDVAPDGSVVGSKRQVDNDSVGSIGAGRRIWYKLRGAFLAPISLLRDWLIPITVFLLVLGGGAYLLFTGI
ncbi:AN1-type zinc finger domain-containing protein [Halovenus halobia]|uniref:AN1-type zinc finger domain-containing protein n=1 Tax=Halovenus halobia TaxID=3396622 RepID=UPI003F5610AD